MSNNKKFFWLKLKEDFFRNKKMKKLRKIAGGDTFTIIYLKMQLLSLKEAGKLIHEGVEEDFAEEIALEIDEDVDNVRITMAFLVSNGLLEEVDTDTYILPQTIECIGSESSSAARMRKHRKKKQETLPEPEKPEKQLPENSETSHCDTPVTKCDTEIEKEKEKEKEIETNKQTGTDILDKRDIENIEFIKGLFVGWSINDFQLLHLFKLARERLPLEIFMDDYLSDLRVYDGLQNLIMRARADNVTYIYRWLLTMIPLETF